MPNLIPTASQSGNNAARLLCLLIAATCTVLHAEIVNTPFVITNSNPSWSDPSQIWVSFEGAFGDSGQAQSIGSTTITDFTDNWQSFTLASMSANTGLAYFNNTPQYTFSLNSFSGRIYVNYGVTALTTQPGPTEKKPYLVFETTVAGQTLNPPNPSQSNIDLSYVDGVSAAGATMARNATTGAALLATSVNPVTTNPNILSHVAALVPSAALVKDGSGNTVRVLSSAAAPDAYHNWTALMNGLASAATNLNVSSYTSPTNSSLVPFGVSQALFGYSGAPPISGQATNFDQMQNYVTTAIFMNDLNPGGTNATLTALGIGGGQAGVVISGTGETITGGGTPAAPFTIYITQANLNLGTGIYGSNPGYVVVQGDTSYATTGIVNDLGGRIVGDLMAGMVFGWSNSTLNIATQAAATGTNLYGTTFSSATVGGLSTGEYFFLLSLAGAQGKLSDWLGSAADPNSNNYDVYLAAIAANSFAYGSGFTDRLEGYANPDTYWYTANPPAIPGGVGNYETVGFVNLYLGSTATIPEPSACVLFGLGAVGMRLGLRRKKTA
ncbi:MAG: hypothetical protein WCH61_04925 [bacterium]